MVGIAYLPLPLTVLFLPSAKSNCQDGAALSSHADRNVLTRPHGTRSADWGTSRGANVITLRRFAEILAKF
jgi:hypothetical protein